MRRALLAVLPLILFFALLPTVVRAQSEPCSCDREQFLAEIRDAEMMFYGSIQKATMESATSDTVQLTLDIDRPVRGPTSGLVTAITTSPYKCGFSATIGMHSFFVIPSGNQPVTRCGGSGSHYYPEGHNLDGLHNLIYAIITVEYVRKDPGIVRAWLNRSYRAGSSRREDMNDFFSLIGELDTDTVISITDNEVVYRNMVFFFADGVLVDYLWNDED
jgi:hypothetical protein